MPDSLLIKKLKKSAEDFGFLLYQNVTIYHHTKSFYIPLLILNPKSGIYLFEYKDWTYDELKNSTIQKATNQESKDDSLAFQRTHTFLRQKLKELTNNNDIAIYNYLLMENLNTFEYKHLDQSYQKLLPEKNVLFNDSNEADIATKLLYKNKNNQILENIEYIIGSLLIQYTILSEEKKVNIATKEQIAFIESDITQTDKLIGVDGGGKTSAIVLKAILEVLKNPKIKIIIIKPTVMACNIIKKKLLDIVEHAIVDLDVTSIKVITPKEFRYADLVMCDDAHLINNEYLNYLKNKQKKSSLILIDPKDKSYPNYNFTKKFTPNKKVYFKQGNPHALTLLKVYELLKDNHPKDILVVSNQRNRKKLDDDLQHFIDKKIILLDGSRSLLYQTTDSVILCSYSDVYELNAKHIILLDVCLTSTDKIKPAYNASNEFVHIFYEDECDKLKTIKDSFE